MKKLVKTTLIVVCSLIIVGVLGVFVFKNTTTIIYPGEGGVKTVFGVPNPKTQHGLVWRIPGISEVTVYNTKQQNANYEGIQLKASNLQNVYLSAAVTYQINDENLPLMVQEYDMNNYVQEILSPKVEAAIQDAIGKNDIWLLVTDKQMVTDAISYILTDKLAKDNYLVIADVNLKSYKFDKEYEQTVLDKLTTEVLLEKAKIQTNIAREEAAQMLEKAMVDPKVAKEMSKAISNPLIIKYEAMKALQNWDGKAPSTIMSGAENALPIIGISK